MDFHTKFTNLKPDERIKNLVQKKIGSLDRFLDKASVVHAWVEVGKTTEHHKEGRVWYAECQLKMPGKKSFRATATCEDLATAIDEVKEELYLLLKKEKEKRINNLKRKP
ncbi:MAG: hypothetical protein UX30_C0025G0005 [Candidatus Saccharibacteria bacterium GW2011_GWA2_46_10]|nr:MAG: hypothetical protein UX30_C0025G0005 [Candidatus Saccharibacteria bacterium GW2011_GWA2_46_10]